MKRVLYIDFENVSQQGLRGIHHLTKNDLVRIFLGPKCSKMSLIDADMVFHCDATVELITNDQIGKNALDFIIMVHLGYDIAKKAGNAYYVVSNDKGYEPAINEMKSMTGVHVERLPDVDAVIARGGEVKTGIFSFLHRVAPMPVADNTTQHEVLGKGQKKTTTTRRTVGNGAGNRSSNDQGNHGGRNDRRQGNQISKNTRSQGGKTQGGRSEGAASRSAEQEKKSAVRNGDPAETAKRPVRSAEETTAAANSRQTRRSGAADAAENRVAEGKENSVKVSSGTVTKRTTRRTGAAAAAAENLVAEAQEQAVETAANAESAAAVGKKSRSKTAVKPPKDEEEIFRRGIAICKTKLEFHNYLAKELDNKDHIQELYNRGKKLVEVDVEALRRENGIKDNE